VSERVFIIGAGQVGQGLNRAFRAAHVDVVGLHSRRPTGAATSSGHLPATIGDANAVIIAVRDEQLDDAFAEVIDAMSPSGRRRVASGTVIVHTSGGAEPQMLSRLGELGLSGGTFHPLVPFANPERARELLKKGWIGIDGDDPARAMSRRLAGHLGARTLDIPPGMKSVYHAAAVISSNFPVVLEAVAARLMMDVGIPERSAQQAVHALVEAAISNTAGAPAEEVLTGPVVRGDAETVHRHLQALRHHPEARALYRRLSFAALEIAARRGTDPDRVAEIQRLLLLR
jgi:predicted short-subunit dehydrogenase-like oxidoreductase (DUF2520 family)